MAELKRLNGQFELMVIYLPGLNHVIHDVGLPDQTARSSLHGYLHGTINRIFKEMGALRDSTVFAVMSDHGHYDTDRMRHIEFTEQGEEVPTSRTMHDVLQVSTDIRARRDLKESANVLFNAQFGMAQVYIAGTRQGDWTQPPSVRGPAGDRQQSLFDPYIEPFGDDCRDRPIADILVRKPWTAVGVSSRPTNTGLLPRQYDVSGQPLESQLVEDGHPFRDSATGRAQFNPMVIRWAYDDPERPVSGISFLPTRERSSSWRTPPPGSSSESRPGDSMAVSRTAASSVPVAFAYPERHEERHRRSRWVGSAFSARCRSPSEALVEAAALESLFPRRPPPATIRK